MLVTCWYESGYGDVRVRKTKNLHKAKAEILLRYRWSRAVVSAGSGGLGMAGYDLERNRSRLPFKDLPSF